MDALLNFTPHGRIIPMLLVILISYLTSFSAAESSSVAVSSQQVQNQNGRHSDSKISYTNATEREWQLESILLVERRVNTDGKGSSPERERQIGNDHEEEAQSGYRTSSLLGITRTTPSSNIRSKRDASSGSESGNSTETSGSSKEVSDVATTGTTASQTTLTPLSDAAATETTAELSETPSVLSKTAVHSFPELGAAEATLQTPPPTTTTPQTPTPPAKTMPPPPATTTTPQTPPPPATTTTPTSAAASTTTMTTPTQPITVTKTEVTEIASITERGISTTELVVCPNPYNITINEVNEREILISWTLEPVGEVRNICVAFVSSIGNNACSIDKRCVDRTDSSKTVSNFCHFHEYTISVDVQCISSDEWKKSAVDYTTKPAAPSQPTNLKCTHVTNVAIALEWSQPIYPNGDITNYTVYWKSSDSRSTNTSETSYTLEKLRPYTQYNISVSAWTSAGESKEKAGPLLLRTEAGLPSEPRNLEPTEVTNATIAFKWSPPSSPNGDIINYTVYWNSPSAEGPNANTSQTFYELWNLEPYTYYNFSVSAWTSAGESEIKAGPLILRTKDGIPDPPENPTVSEVSNTTLTLGWSPPSVSKGGITNYSVYWKISDSTRDYESNLTEENNLKLENLKPYTDYTLVVSAWTSAGESRMSEEVVQQTKEGIPGAPQNLSVENGTDTSVTLRWFPPSEQNGIILKYEVSWSHSSDGSGVEIKTDTTSEIFLRIDDLYPYVNYTLSVSAWTIIGRGAPSVEKLYQTDVGVPSEPKNAAVVSRGSKFLALSWEKPEKPRGPIDGYIVSWQETGDTEARNFDTKSGEVQTHEIEGLLPFTKYTLWVTSYNKNRGQQVLKSEKSTIQDRTSADIPSAPRDVAVFAFSNTTLSVTWQTPEPPNGIIQKYTLYCKSVGDSDNKSYTNIEDTKYVVSGLNPFTVYNITVSAATSAGEGPKSNLISHRTDVGVPSAPRNVSVYATDTSMYIEWSKPEFQRGPIDGFYVCWEKCSDEKNRTTVPENKNASSEVVIGSCSTIAVCKYNVSSLDPWTNYTIGIEAYNRNHAQQFVIGPQVLVEQATSAAVPEEPILDDVTVLNSTAVMIRWMYKGRYPGPLSYTVEIETDISVPWVPCARYNKRNVTKVLVNEKAYVTDLTPYTHYFFRVFATTEAGSSRSNESRARTNPDVPGPPLDAKANCADSPTTAFVSWKTPDRENGLIEEYKIKYGPKGENFNHKEVVVLVDQPKFCGKRVHRAELHSLHPETDYEISIMAKTQNVNSYGESANLQPCVLPAGVPPFPKNDALPEVSGTNQQEAKLAISKTTFSSEMGEIRHYAIIVAFSHNIGKPMKGNTTIAQTQKLPVWIQFWKQTSDIYQATPDLWNPFKKNAYDPLHCQPEHETEEGLLYCTIGWEKNCSEVEPMHCKNCSEVESMYCNGPLIPGKRYGIKLRGFTAGGYSETYPIYIVTAPIDPESPVGIIVGLIFLFLVALLVAGAIFLEKRNNFKTLNRMRNFLRKKETSSVEQNIDIDLNKVGTSGSSAKTRPMNFTTFLEHVKLMMSDSFLRFSLEYEEIKQNSPKHPFTAAEMEENRMKNRWMNIFPFDHSRVKLLPIDDEPSSDYINANYIPGFTSHREYIATQGPLPNTVDDFWRMVWEQGVTMIVMLTQCVERGKKKCEQYWPTDSDNVYYGDLKIQLKSESILSAYCIRIFDLQLGSRQHTVKQMHFTKWPDFGSPESPEDLINFVQAVRDHLPHTNTGPILVHCSAGVGRTGTFIAVDRLLQHIQYHNDINIYNTVVEMREYRTNMVQTEDQYIYIHKCMRDIISQRLHPRTSIYDDEDDERYSNISPQQATEL